MRYGKVYYYDRMGNRHCNPPQISNCNNALNKNLFHIPQKGNLRITDDNYSTGLSKNVLNDECKAFHPDYPFKPNFLETNKSEIDFFEHNSKNQNCLNDYENENSVSEDFQQFISSDTDSLVKKNNKIDKIYDNFVSTSGVNVIENYEKQADLKSLNKFLTDTDNKIKKSPSYSQDENYNDNDLRKFSYSEAIERCVNSKNNVDYVCVSPKPIKGIISPLNSLYSKTNSNVLEKERFAHELDKISFDNAKNFGFTATKDDFNLDLVDINRSNNQFGDNDSNSMCSQCLCNQSNKDDRPTELKKKLVNHVDEINYELSKHLSLESFDNQASYEFPKFEGLTEKETKEKEQSNKIRYRQELQEVIENRKQKLLIDKEKQKQANNAANTLDAKLFAEEKERSKLLEIIEQKKQYEDLRDQIELRKTTKNKEDSRLEWWEIRPNSKILSHKEAEEEHIMGQLRRNFALKESINMLKDFKNDQRNANEEHNSIRQYKQSVVNKNINNQAEFIRNDFGKRKIPVEQNLDVFKAWEEAHKRNDCRYRVLQDSNNTMRSSLIKSGQKTMSEKHCKKCNRILKNKRRY